MRKDWVSTTRKFAEKVRSLLKIVLNWLHFAEEIFWVVLDISAPFLWEIPATHKFIGCELCGDNIVRGRVRQVYIRDQAMTHYRCPNCSLDHYYFNGIIPIRCDRQTVELYNERFGSSKEGNSGSGEDCRVHFRP